MRFLGVFVVIVFLATVAMAAKAPPANLHCPGDQVVWLNERTLVYHFEGSRWFGATHNGKFLCEADAKRQGARASLSEQ